MTENNERNFKQEIKELKIQELISKQPSYDEFTKNAVSEKDKNMTKEEYAEGVREACRLQVITDEFKAATAQYNVDVYEKSSVLGLRKFMESELQEQKDVLNKQTKLLTDDRFRIIGKAIQYLMSKHGKSWCLDGVYEVLEDKETTDE